MHFVDALEAIRMFSVSLMVEVSFAFLMLRATLLATIVADRWLKNSVSYSCLNFAVMLGS